MTLKIKTVETFSTDTEEATFKEHIYLWHNIDTDKRNDVDNNNR